MTCRQEVLIEEGYVSAVSVMEWNFTFFAGQLSDYNYANFIEFACIEQCTDKGNIITALSTS